MSTNGEQRHVQTRTTDENSRGLMFLAKTLVTVVTVVTNALLPLERAFRIELWGGGDRLVTGGDTR
jgi:hypothetical protein